MARKTDISGLNDDGVLDAMGITDPPPVSGKKETSASSPVVAGVPANEQSSSDDTALQRMIRQSDAYADTFLSFKQAGGSVRHVTIDLETAKKLEYIISVVFSNEVSIFNFVDNILNHHFEKYKGEFLYRRKNRPKSFLDE
jgi:hypothetical protein